VINFISANNETLEKQLIAWMIAHNEFVDVPEGFFYSEKVLKIYKAWKTQYFHSGHFNALMIPEECTIVLSECMELSSGVNNKIVIHGLRRYYNVREFFKSISNQTSLIDKDYENINEVIQKIGSIANDLIMESEDSQVYEHEHSVFEYMEELQEGQIGKKDMRGESAGLPDLDLKINGWELGKVYLISGLEKLGKSRFVRHLFNIWLKKGFGCAMFLLEEDAAAVHECILANRAVVNTNVMGTNIMNQYQMKKLCTEATEYMNQPLYVSNKSGITPQYVRAAIQKQKIIMGKKGHKLMFVAIDYVQRMTADGLVGHEANEYIASELANIARDENVCMILVSQMSSSAEKTKGLPLHTQLRYGKVFKEAASCIITFDDPARRNMEEKGKTEDSKLIIANVLQRRGESGFNTYLRAQLQYSSFACEANFGE